MVAIPDKRDPALALADAALVAAQEPRFRAYLGMSQIAAECSRQLWYNFRWVMRPAFDAATLKRFADGHASEAVLIARLKAVDNLEVHDTDDTGEQFGFKDLGGHFRGHMDFVILGLPQAPLTWHVGEAKASEKWTDLDKARAAVGEKNALAKWNPVYYGQAVLYMDYAGLDRHWLVCTSAGARKETAVRTNADPAHALVLKQKAERIIFADRPLDTIGGPDSFACRWCDFAAICHGDQAPLRNCRTCLNSTPERAGGWTCSLDPENVRALTLKDQEAGCPSHRFIPALIGAEQVDIRGDSIIYRRPDGSEWVDEGHDEGRAVLA